MTENKNGAVLLPPDYLHEQNECVKMLLIRDYAGYCFTEDTRQTLIFNGIPCKTLADLQAIQNDLPALLAKDIISDVDADLCARAVKEYRKSEPDGERIYNTFRNMEMAVTRLRDMLRLHSEHLPDEAGERSARGLIVAITNAAGLAVRQLKQKPDITIQTLKSITDIYSLLIMTCYHAELWHGGRPDGPIGEFVKTGPYPGGFPSFTQLYVWAVEYKLISIPPESFAADIDEYARAVADATENLTGYKEELKTAGEEWPQPPDAVESYADELIKIPSVKSRAARHYFAANDTISNHLNSQTTESLKINGGTINLPDKYRQNAATKTVIIPASLESEFEFNHEITEYDRAVSNAVYSLIEEGNSVFTAAMIYRAMTGKTDGGKIPPAQQKLIDRSMEKLAVVRVSANLLEAAKKRKVVIDGEPAENLETLKIQNYLLPTKSITAEINGKTTIAYSMIETPPLYRWAKTTRQITTLPIEIMDVKKVRGGRISCQSENANENRTAIINYLLRRLQAINNRAGLAEYVQTKAKRKKTNKKETTAHTEIIRYDSVMKAAGVDWDSMPRQHKERHRKFIRTCLENWQNNKDINFCGFEFEEYKDKNKIVGIRITYPIN